MCHRAEKLVVLNDTPIGVKGIVCLGATHYVCPRQTAEEQSAAFALKAGFSMRIALIIGLPDTIVVNKGQQGFRFTS